MRMRRLSIAQTLKPAGLLSPWKPGLASATESSGWITYSFDDSGDTAGKIWVVDRHAVAAWSWAVFVFAVGFGWWFGRRTWFATATIFGTVTAIALIVPAAWAPMTAAVWLGLVVGQLLTRIWSPARSAVSVAAGGSESTSRTKRLVTAGTAICLFAIFALRNSVRADEPASSPTQPSRSDIRQVLIPVDKDQHPTGGLYFLAESFYDELVRDTAQAKIAKPQYLITKAVYQAQIGRDAANGELTSGDWQAAFDIESLSDRASLQFPFDSQSAALVPDGIKVDGQAGVFHWDEKQHSLAIELARVVGAMWKCCCDRSAGAADLNLQFPRRRQPSLI